MECKCSVDIITKVICSTLDCLKKYILDSKYSLKSFKSKITAVVVVHFLALIMAVSVSKSLLVCGFPQDQKCNNQKILVGDVLLTVD